MPDPVAQLQDEIRSISLDHALEPADRHARLRAVRESLAEVMGEADRRLADSQKMREARASSATRELLWARGNADIREELLRLGEASEEALDAEGLLSHAELDRLQEEGLLEEAVLALAKRVGRGGGSIHSPLDPDFEKLHRRGRAGQWVDMPGMPTPPEKIPPTPGKPLERPTAPRPGVAQPHLAAPPGVDPELHAEHDEMQMRALADWLAVKAEHAEKDVTPALQGAISAIPGARLEGLQHRLKSRSSIVSKIKRKREKMPKATDQQRAESITDLVRYTAVVPTGSYNKGVEDTLGVLEQRGFKPVEIENYWGGGDDYDGFHVGLESPTGVQIELQFHTEESLDVKERLQHPIYEKFRESQDAHERWQLWQEMVENTKLIPKPKGVDELAPVKVKPAPTTPHGPGLPLPASEGDKRADPGSYLHEPAGSQRVPLDAIKPTRLRREAQPEARKRMDAALSGEGDKRKPLSVRDNGDGTFELLDGNTTHSILKERGASHAIVKVERPKGEAPQSGPTGTEQDPIPTGDVDEAVALLAQGKHVRLEQPHQVSTLVGRLAQVVQEMQAKGQDAPNFDLCKVSVKGTNIFCAGHKGIERIHMPQLAGTPLPGSKAAALNNGGNVDLAAQFRQHLIEEKGVTVTSKKELASYLRASQRELDGQKVSGMANHLGGGGSLGGPPLFVDSNNYIVDGHHRWAAELTHDLADGIPDSSMDVDQIDADILQVLQWANEFAKEWGIPQAGLTAGREDPLPPAATKGKI